MANVHDAAQRGYTSEVQAYSRGRPEYPEALDGWLRGTLRLGAGKRVADVGAGTGKFSKLLLATGADVIAVEPIDAMRAEAAKVAGLHVAEGSASQIPLPDAGLDAIVCATAFHWFANHESLDEFARVLKPGGKLGLIWNVRDESVDWVARITEIITPYEGDAPRFYKGDWKKAFPHRSFTPLQESRFPHEHVGSAQQVIMDRFMSVSFIAAQPHERREQARRDLQQLADTHPELRGRDVIRFPYYTVAFDCVRT